MADKAAETEQEKPGMIKRLAKDLGLEDDFVKDVGGQLVKEFVKDKLKIGGRHSADKSKFGKTVDTLKSMWWVPAALIVTVGLAVLTIKLMARLAGIDL